jgi:hypothetical protein
MRSSPPSRRSGPTSAAAKAGISSGLYGDPVAQRHLEVGCGPLLVDDDGSLIRAHGIPYATAERFAAPVPAARHSDVRDATKRGPACPQLPSRLDFVNGPWSTSSLAASNVR